jgi:hypothetical protein
MMSYRGKWEREKRKEKREKRDTAGSVVRSGELEQNEEASRKALKGKGAGVM